MHDVSESSFEKEKQVAFGSEENTGVLLQLLQKCEPCPAPKFQEAIGEMRWK